MIQFKVRSDAASMKVDPAVICQGPKGEKGDTGAQGTAEVAGTNAIINGVNALTLNTGEGLSGSQNGNAYTRSLASHTQAAGTVTAGTLVVEYRPTQLLLRLSVMRRFKTYMPARRRLKGGN